MYGNPQGIGLINVAMSNFSKGFTNPALMCFQLAPVVPVTRRSFQYMIFDRSNQRIIPTRRAPGGQPVQLSMSYSTDNYICDAYAAEVPMPRENQATAEQLGFQLTQKATTQVMDVISLERESKVIALAKTVTNVTTPTGTDLWDNAASNPVAQIENIKYTILESGVAPNTLILGPDMYKAARLNPQIKALFQYVQGGVINDEMLALAFGVSKVLQANAVSVDGTDTPTFMWKGMAVLAYLAPVTTQMDLSAMKTFVDTTQGIDGYEVLEFPDPHASKKVDYVSGEMAYDLKITANETIGVITGGTAQP